tara:strand:- start:702 stop:1343 length:642 start_codon:yes stop_codon:yes gene_type:complete
MKMTRFLILFISIPIFGFSQYGSLELSTGGFSFIPAFTDPNPNINFNAGTGNKKLVSAYMVGSIRMNTLNLRSLFFVTQIKILDKKSKKLKLSGGVVLPLIQIEDDYSVNTYFSQRIAANYSLSKKLMLNATYIHGKGINNDLEINLFSLSGILQQKKFSFITQFYYLDLDATYGIAETVNYRLSSSFDLRGFINQTLSSNQFIWTLGLRYNL